jgi:signal transduction histidine kinase
VTIRSQHGPEERSVGLCVLASLGFVAAAAATSLVLHEWVQFVPSVAFFLAVMLAAWYGGRLGGLLATITAVVAMDYVLFEPQYTLAPNSGYISSAFAFGFAALIVTGLTSRTRAAQVELQHLNDTLEDRVRERTAELRSEMELRSAAERELARKHEELLRSNAELEEFASVASHDLREPLRTVVAFSALLQRRHAMNLPEEANEYLEYVVHAGRRMEHMLDDLLRYARANNEPFQYTRVSLLTVLTGVRESLQGILDESGARLTNDPLPSIEGNESQLARVVQNLIANAVKYRRESEAPCIHVWADRNGEEWVVAVRDNGMGFDPALAEAVFKPFKRLSPNTAPGSGMGLPICKKIVERHGGRIWAESVPGQGSIFRFSLPQIHHEGFLDESPEAMAQGDGRLGSAG